MAHNDSTQVFKVLHPEDPGSGRDNDGTRSNKPQSDVNTSTTKPEAKEPPKGSGSGRACCPHGASGASYCGASCTADVRRGQVERTGWSTEDGGSSCCPLRELKRLSECNTGLGNLTFSRTHAVLVNVRTFNEDHQIQAQVGTDTWQSDFVKMPCSQRSVMTKSGFMGNSPVRRWDVILKQLETMSKKSSVDVADVAKAILKYNPKYDGQWTFDGLAHFVKIVPKEENYFSSLFPKIAELALKLPDYIKRPIPLLQARRPASITLSQRQISSLLANAFFCTFPHRNTSGPNTEYHGYPTINFTSLFGKFSERKKEKLRAILHYFKAVTDNPPSGLVTFERRCLRDTDLPHWRSSEEKLQKLHVTSEGSIEGEGAGMLQVDFAASWIGGGVLNSGLLQEEILFLIYPELIVSRLFTQKLEDNECLIITGCQQFSMYHGFGDTFEWGGPYFSIPHRDKWCRVQRQIVAIDALNFKHRSEQFSMRKVLRELNKAYCGFKKEGHEEPDVATGKWGCGAFNGDPQLKALIQLMAAAKAHRGLAFFTFGDNRVKGDLEQMYSLLLREDIRVGKLFELIENYCDLRTRHGLRVDLFEYIRTSLRPARL